MYICAYSYTYHWQSVMTVLPASAFELTGHTTHEADPVTALKEPAGHALQGPPLGPLYPALH